MKKVTLILAALVVSTSLVSCGNEKAAAKVKKENVQKAASRDTEINKGTAQISFDKTVFDFGTVNEGDLVDASFVITNTGATDLIITKAQATCGCTVPVWPKEAIKPGESADLKAKFNTAGKRNKQSKSITLTTNTAAGREIVKITGFVTPDPNAKRKGLPKGVQRNKKKIRQ